MGTQHPYLINHNVGWANDDVVIHQESNRFKIGDKVSFDGLWTKQRRGILSKQLIVSKTGKNHQYRQRCKTSLSD